MKNYLFIAIFLSIYLALFDTSFANSTLSKSGDEEPTITIMLRQVPLNKVFDIITAQTGFIVMIDGSYENQLVSGNFTSVEVSSFLRRIFKGKNPLITTSSEKKRITILLAGSSKNVTQLVSYALDNTSSPKVEVKPTGTNRTVTQKPNDLTAGVGVYELDNNMPPKVSGNNHHLIDPMTGKSWDEMEKLINQ